MVKSGSIKVEVRKGNALESLTRGSAQPPRCRYGAIDRAKFLRRLRRVGSIDSASIGSQTNYGLDLVALGILSDGASKLAFHLFDSAANTISFSLPFDAVFEGRSGRKRRSKGGARRSCRGFLSFFLQRGCAPLSSADTLTRSLVRSSVLSTEVSFGSSREACGRWLVITLEEGAEVGRGKENLGNFRPTSLIVEVLMVPPLVYLKRIRY